MTALSHVWENKTKREIKVEEIDRIKNLDRNSPNGKHYYK